MKHWVLLLVAFVIATPAFPESPAGLEDRLATACPDARYVTVDRSESGTDVVYYLLEPPAKKSQVDACIFAAYEEIKKNPFPVNTQGIQAATKVRIEPNGTIVLY